MALIRWSPTSEIMKLDSEMDRIVSELSEGLGLRPRVLGNGRNEASAFLPLDIERTDNALVVQASVPGFAPEEVTVTVDNGVLTIDARHQQESERKDRNLIRQERFTGRLYRQITLGEDVKGEEANATFKDGVLTVTVPMMPRPEPKRIPVQVSQS
jgi:HSP20 family protein